MKVSKELIWLLKQKGGVLFHEDLVWLGAEMNAKGFPVNGWQEKIISNTESKTATESLPKHRIQALLRFKLNFLRTEAPDLLEELKNQLSES